MFINSSEKIVILVKTKALLHPFPRSDCKGHFFVPAHG